MQILVDTKIDFMGKRRLTFAISAALLLISVASLVLHGGPRLSIDFTGGTFVQLAFEPPISAEELRSSLAGGGLASVELQSITGSSEFIIRLQNEEVDAVSAELFGDTGTDANAYTVIHKLVEQNRPDVVIEVLRQEKVGPKIGGELREKAVQSILVALLLMLIYIAFRFAGIFFAVGAVVAIFHDVVITLGVFSILGKEVSLTILAALLTIAGYSVNDTIVVFDRIREQVRLSRRETLEQVINKSVNMTLSRTVLTSLTTLFAVLALYFLGGSVIHDFAFAVLVGVLVGTYSSIFVASALVLEMSDWRSNRERSKGASRGAGASKKATAKKMASKTA